MYNQLKLVVMLNVIAHISNVNNTYITIFYFDKKSETQLRPRALA